MVYRHIAYVYQLRTQLLQPAPWEHISLAWIFGSFNRRRQSKILSAYATELDSLKSQAYFSKEDAAQLGSVANVAPHLLDKQTEKLQQLFQQGEINYMQQMELQKTINGFYEEQGKDVPAPIQPRDNILI